MVFPAFLENFEVVSAEAVSGDTESSCFYHPAKKAKTACESCGRFICSLCEVDLNGTRLCPQCLDNGKRKGKLTRLEGSRTLYDNIALLLSLTGILGFTAVFTVVTAPLALYTCLRYRNAPRSLVRPGRWKWWTALILSSLQIIGWVVLIIILINSGPSKHSNRHQRPDTVSNVTKRRVK